jgi:hypothetical protein
MISHSLQRVRQAGKPRAIEARSDDEMLTEKIRKTHAASRGIYVAPRVHAAYDAQRVSGLSGSRSSRRGSNVEHSN